MRKWRVAEVMKEVSLSDLPPCIFIVWIFVDGGGCSELLWAPCAPQVAEKDTWDHGNRRKVLHKGISRKELWADTGHLPPSRKKIRNNTQCCCNNLEMSKCYRGLNLQMSQRGPKEWMEQGAFSCSPGCTNALWFKEGDIVTDNIILPGSQTKCFWKPPTLFRMLCSLCI